MRWSSWLAGWLTDWLAGWFACWAGLGWAGLGWAGWLDGRRWQIEEEIR